MKPLSKILSSVFIFVILLPVILTGCDYSSEDLDTVVYTPVIIDDWETSTPQDEGLDADLVSQLYLNAEKIDTIRSVLVIKNGKLIAEKYFNDGSIDYVQRIQSCTKSFTSALIGIAIEQGYIESVDQKMMDFFPELSERITDQRKNEITIEQMLQMRAGYPSEESSQELMDLLYGGFYTSYLADVPLVRDPGTGHDYSNLTSHLLGVIVARSSGKDLRTFAQENLFIPLDMELGDWITDWEGNYNGHGDIHLTARDMAKFGLLYINEGMYNGEQLVPAEWIDESLQVYTDNAYGQIGRNLKDVGYGYQWWSAQAGQYRYYFAWGHGGQVIALVRELNLLVVVTADPFWGDHSGNSWKYEKANLNLVADFISTLPGE